MKRSHPSLHFLAGTTTASDVFAIARTTIIMSFRPPYPSGRNQWRRRFSDRPDSSGNDQFVSGDSHFRSVTETNQGYRPVEGGNYTRHNNPYRPNPRAPPFHPRPAFNQNQPSRPPGPQHFNQNQRFPPPGPAYYNQNQQFRPHYHQNQQIRPHFHQDQQFRPPQWRPRAPDHRDWEYAKSRPPPDGERFTVLSYNILADYLALNHRNQLYFHIPHFILAWEFRKRNILSELGWWSADILCFQEVDRFHDLEDDLKLKGYTGLWKMRTGDPVDGCAIFWRTSRFKLLHQECIEFNKLGLRDNVALICVLESMSQKNGGCAPSLPESSAGANRVVICNIHVLYNPRRGEIKLGQVRGLLDKAYAVSKLWDNAPVVVCGDFNCTPKSPLYNFIAEQKLNVTELPRDKLSGQTSAEIRPPPPYSPNPRPHSGPQASVGDKEVKQNDASLDMPNMSSSNINLETTPCSSSLEPLSENIVSNASPSSSIEGQNDDGNNVLSHEMMNNILQCKEDVCNKEIELTSRCQVSSSNGNDMAGSSDEGDINLDIVTLSRQEATTSIISQVSSGEQPETTLPGENEIVNSDVGMSDHCSTDAAICDLPGNASNLDKTLCNQLDASYPFNAAEISPTDTPKNVLPLSVTNGKETPTMRVVDFSGRHGRADSVVDETMEKSLRSELGEDSLDGSIGEDSAKSPSELHNADVNLPSDMSRNPRSGSVDGTESLEVLDDLSGVDREPFKFDPSGWTAMEIELATGSAECTFVEHQMKLRSTYTEVEDHSSTRDSAGEPQVTSYHRRFSGTVDYIWRSEGLQTVKVLAPIQRQAMQRTPGFPTKKWGSDHIALVTELVFRKDDVQHSR